MKDKALIGILIFGSITVGSFFYFRHQVYFSHGSRQETKIFEVQKGEGGTEVAANLRKDNLIARKPYFLYYMQVNGLMSKILPGAFELSGQLTIPEIAVALTDRKDEFVRVTFPEGWRTAEMAKRLTEAGLPGADFLALAQKPDAELLGKYDFLSGLPVGKSLEGYLFPDTYFFSQDATGRGIIQKMLNNFDLKLSAKLRASIQSQKKTAYEVLIMASIVEREVKTLEDKKLVSGLFWQRVAENRGLQSCATLAYILGENKKQYTFADTRIDSPYNTYLYRGLPPGPISNPGLDSIEAAVNPTPSRYQYFLTDPETGRTIFSQTIDEHNTNKVKYGL